MTDALRVLCWDHPRCVAPVRAGVEAWLTGSGNRQVHVEARPLQSFNDEPVRALAQEWDLIFIDHPAVGDCAADGSLVPLDDHVSREMLDELGADSAGASHASYTLHGHQWALAMDAACQTAVWRPDLLDSVGLPRPTTWDDVIALAQARPGQVLWPLYPTDAALSLISISAQLRDESDLSHRDVGDLVEPAAIEILLELLPFLHPASHGANPPQLLELMTHTDEVLYSPLAFCYATYQRSGRERRVQFGAPPASRATVPSAVVGGAGLAVSAFSPRVSDAVDLAVWLTSGPVQSSVVPSAGGQPGRRSAWMAAGQDPAYGGFFADVLPVLDRSVLRPTAAGWPARQERLGRAVQQSMAAQPSARELLAHVRAALSQPGEG